MKKLNFFEKKEIKAGSKFVYSFEIDPIRDLSYVDSRETRHLEAGEYFVKVKDQRVKFEIVD